jgi:cell fate (sporulation/competence/biofilm development) regulator YlbF (YheA/YmcA/DUF963 family)
MDDVIEHAKKLAEALAANERTKAFHAAAAAVEADPVASRLQETYATAVQAVHEREAAGQPIEPEHKRAFAQAADAVRRSPILLRMLKAHAEYAEMMDAVQSILAGATGEEGPDDHEHGPGCDHGHDEGHEGHSHGAPAKRDEEPPPKSVLWTP